MHEPRRLLLISKANNYIAKLKAKEYSPDGKTNLILMYQIDTMIYRLASINTEDWQGYLRAFKETKYLLRTHSMDENTKKDNYNKAAASVLLTLEKYIEYLQLQ